MMVPGKDGSFDEKVLLVVLFQGDARGRRRQ
jgi:hypothetical protein